MPQSGGDELGERLLLVSLEWSGVLSPLKRTELTQQERAWLADFQCSRARCAVPRERQILISAVREVWGSEAAFEAFVRDKLPAVLEASKRRYSRQAQSVLLQALDRMFGG